MENVEPVKRVVADDAFGTETGRTPVRIPAVRAPGMRKSLGAEARWRPHRPMTSGKASADFAGLDHAGPRSVRVERNGRSVSREVKEYLAATGAEKRGQTQRLAVS